MVLKTAIERINERKELIEKELIARRNLALQAAEIIEEYMDEYCLGVSWEISKNNEDVSKRLNEINAFSVVDEIVEVFRELGYKVNHEYPYCICIELPLLPSYELL